MSDTASAVYFCDACGTIAGSVELSDASDEQLCLRVVGTVAENSYFLSRNARLGIVTALRTASSLVLYQLAAEYAPFFCPDCAKNYCRNCWKTTAIFDDDFPGWYDSTEGYCPQGHRRLLDD